MKSIISIAFLVAIPRLCSAQEPVTLAEDFKPGHAYKVEVEVKLAGKLALPAAKGKPPQIVPVNGASRVQYDERILKPADAASQKALRAYRAVEFRRTIGANQQDAAIRPSVRRMVVIRKDGRRAPFSPDGPLTWGEIDVVRSDVFNPAAIPGLLPRGPVKVGQTWKASPAAVAEITDMQKVNEGSLTVEFAGLTTLVGKPAAKLRLTGTIRGINEDGPNRQKIVGALYFNLESKIVSYLSIKGAHELLDGESGRTVGTIEGQFIMTRFPIERLPDDLADEAIQRLTLKPDAENTQLLYDDPILGVRFLYPRGWRVGAVQGRQITIDQPKLGGGILITLEPAGKVPTAESYRREVAAFLQKENAVVKVASQPMQVRAAPGQLDRFTLEAVFEKDSAVLEYAVLKQTDGGATVAARLPTATARELKPEVERVIRSLSVTRKLK